MTIETVSENRSHGGAGVSPEWAGRAAPKTLRTQARKMPREAE